MTVTLTQLAKDLSLSPATVSCILNGKTERFSQATIDRVLAKVAQTGYRPNSSARAMRTGRFGCYALLHKTGRGRSHLPGRLLEGLSDALSDRGLHLSFGHLPDDRLEDVGYLPKVLRELTADGLLVNYHKNFPEQLQQQIDLLRVPAVWINAEVPGLQVRPEDRAAARAATEHLLGLGHRRIAYADLANDLTIGKHFSVAERQAGYDEAMQTAGLPQIHLRNPARHGHEAWRSVAAEHLRGAERPTAVVTYSPDTALAYLLAALGDCRLEVPRDLSVIAVGEDALFGPSIAIDQMAISWYRLGQRAVATLHAEVERRNGKDLDPEADQALDEAIVTAAGTGATEFVAVGTTGPAPADA